MAEVSTACSMLFPRHNHKSVPELVPESLAPSISMFLRVPSAATLGCGSFLLSLDTGDSRSLQDARHLCQGPVRPHLPLSDMVYRPSCNTEQLCRWHTN